MSQSEPAVLSQALLLMPCDQKRYRDSLSTALLSRLAKLRPAWPLAWNKE